MLRREYRNGLKAEKYHRRDAWKLLIIWIGMATYGVAQSGYAPDKTLLAVIGLVFVSLYIRADLKKTYSPTSGLKSFCYFIIGILSLIALFMIIWL